MLHSSKPTAALRRSKHGLAHPVRARRQKTCHVFTVKAADEDEEIPSLTPGFQARRLTPLPADFGTAEAKQKPRKKIPLPNSPATTPDSPASPSDTPQPASPASSPFAKSPPASKPAASPFAGSSTAPTASTTSPFASSQSPAKPSSPFAGTAAPASPATSPFAPKSGKPASPFSSSSGPVGTPSSNPFESPPASFFADPIIEKQDDVPFWEKIKPSWNNLILVFTFSSIIGLMLATFWVVVQAGGISLNDN
ncbi:hypothetical protein CYMTET_6622 [Cymbomonas tetramitiformis]|uniref:Uncharacterized protein n=1 Tax=Cymbomonas tetramitiformis TaxID=36881 RepID=A0AAE0LHV8_9CHLO|nr:hypothetical protein CYMTET_6622 [Cymbomonas tetramitiformis]